jgi:hypothetical protein
MNHDRSVMDHNAMNHDRIGFFMSHDLWITIGLVESS